VIDNSTQVRAMSMVEHSRTKGLLPPLVAGQDLDQPTFHERYEAMPAQTRAELVGGVVYMPSPMKADHGDKSRIVAFWLGHYQWKTPQVKGSDGATVMLDLHGEPQPDHLLRIPADLGGQTHVERGYLVGAPELIVEVARSSRDYDLNQKKSDYERAGVCEYVVVELDPNRVHWFVRRRKRFQILRPRRDGVFRSEIFPGLWLDPEALFTDDLDRLMAILEQGLTTPDHAEFAAKLIAPRKASD
jgi:Uma2 family endonuclease